MLANVSSGEPLFLEYLDHLTTEIDILFRNVATTKKYNENHVEKQAISLNVLSDFQCQKIRNTIELLVKLNEEASGFRNRNAEYRDLESVPNPWLKYRQSEPDPTLESLKHTNALQRDYLVLELCRSEDLQKQLKEREDFIVTLTAERDALAKKLLMNKALLSEQEQQKLRSHVEDSTKIKVEEEPESLLHSFVRKDFNGKWFFGIIAKYKEPYFKVCVCYSFCISSDK